MGATPVLPLIDSFGRVFEYLRLSVTDRCNFRCTYCLPNGYVRPAGELEEELTSDEIRRLVAGFASMGFWKVRLTGGEPTVRRDIVELAGAVASVPGIRRVAISTNGYRLASIARELREAGMTAVNLSVDSLDPERFRQITGSGRFEEVIRGVDAALECGFESVKVNAVLLRGWNDDELARFVEWVRARPVSVRFIELMRTGKNKELFEQRHVSGGEVQLALLRGGWMPRERRSGDGPAAVYEHPDYQGTLGIIAPYSEGFCDSCNRLRVSARGRLRLCLFGEGDFSLRPYLQDDSQREELALRVRALLTRKAVSHFLHEGNYGSTWNLSQIGG